MRSVQRPLLALAALACAAGWAGQALAWGAMGHRLVGQLGAEALPPSLPAFLRTPRAALDIGELSREPDRWKNAGRAHDQDMEGGHFLDVDDQGKALGGLALDHLPTTRAEYEKLLQAAGTDSWKAGYLPYSLIEGWQLLAKDFAMWRADVAGEKRAKDRRQKAWLTADRLRHEEQVIHDLGVWSHYVGDASQPLHATIHYNGWGPGPNPNGYTLEHIHAPFEGALVFNTVKPQAVRAAMRPYRDCQCRIDEAASAYIAATAQKVIPLYELEKAGGLKPGDPRGTAFATQQIAEGAAELRDMVVDAWNASGKLLVGYPPVPLADIESGKADAYKTLYGVD